MNVHNPALTVEMVDILYKKRESLNIPGYYEEGEKNPFDGLCSIVPKSAKYYTVIADGDLSGAIRMMKNLRRHKKVQCVKTNRDFVNYTHYAKAGDVTVVFV